MRNIVPTLGRMFRVEHQKVWLLGTVAILVALLAIQGARYYQVGRFEKTLMGSLDQDSQAPPKREDVKPQEDYNPIAEKGMLGSVKKPPQHALWGILGEEALFGPSADAANPLKVGGKLPSGEEIIRIGINDVVLAKDGKERTVYVHDALQPAKTSKPSPSPTEGGTTEQPTADPSETTGKPPADAPQEKDKETGQNNASASVLKSGQPWKLRSKQQKKLSKPRERKQWRQVKDEK